MIYAKEPNDRTKRAPLNASVYVGTFFCQIVVKIRERICKDPYRKEAFESAFGNNCYLFESNPNICEDIFTIVEKYAKKNIIVVKAFIGDPYYTEIVRDRKITVIQMIGNAGGLLGLCIGFSFISLVELLYHLILLLWGIFKICLHKE